MNSSIPSVDHPLSANGRFGRLSYLGWSMLLGVVIGILVLLFAILFVSSLHSSASLLIYLAIGLLIVLYIAAVYCNFVFTIRRLHDRNQTGWLSLLMLAPLVNLFFLIYLCCAKGDEQANDYGAPRTTQGWEKVFAWIYIILIPLCLIVGIIAAIAMPNYQQSTFESQQFEMEQHQNAE